MNRCDAGSNPHYSCSCFSIQERAVGIELQDLAVETVASGVDGGLVGSLGFGAWVDVYVEGVLVPGGVCYVVDFFYSGLRLDPLACRGQDPVEACVVFGVGVQLVVPCS